MKLALLLSTLVLAGCSDDPALTSIEGDVMAFLTEVPGPRVTGAMVRIVEAPDRVVTTGADAHFRFDGLEVGSSVTLEVTHPDFKTTRTATLVLGEGGVNPFPVQIVARGIFDLLAMLVPMPPEEERFCVIATTVARFGGSLYVRLRQGMPGVSVALTPALTAESGPLYFNEMVIPDATQPATSIDGGALFYRVPPGDYVLRASMDGAVFNEVNLGCVAGVIVNAGPPLGIVANLPAPDYAAGASLADDDFTRASDALCEATAACVNEDAMAENYPAATVASCKAMFRNVWASVDGDCDAANGVRAAARALYECRTTNCELTLGDDTACATEDTAFRAAEAEYGRCVSR